MQVNSLRLKSSVTSKWASKHLLGWYHLFCCWWNVLYSWCPSICHHSDFDPLWLYKFDIFMALPFFWRDLPVKTAVPCNGSVILIYHPTFYLQQSFARPCKTLREVQVMCLLIIWPALNWVRVVLLLLL